MPCHSSCPTGAAPQALAVTQGVLPQHWLAGLVLLVFELFWLLLQSFTHGVSAGHSGWCSSRAGHCTRALQDLDFQQ